jgi:Arc/MetJ family transcription regulator
MAVTQIDLDDEALAEAMRLSGETTKQRVVNLALQEYVDRHRRIEALEHHAKNAKGWSYRGWQEVHQTDKRPAG